jgi:hypothetical protein
MSRPHPSPPLIATLAGLLASCVGSVDDAQRAPTPGPGREPAAGGPGAPPKTQTPREPAPAGVLDDGVGPAPLRRLTRAEYDNTIRDLLDDPSRPAGAFAGDLDAEGTGFVRGGAVSAVDARHLLEAAEKVSATAVRRLDALLPCAPVPTAAKEQDACVRTFVGRFARRAFRRPPTTAEVESLLATYSRARAEPGNSFADAVGVVLQVVLQSPSFLYRWELGPDRPIREGALVRFNHHEVASRLSYALWASMPDQMLFAAADAGQLGTPDAVERQARRMLADPKAKEMLADFGSQWLAITDLLLTSKDAKAYPSYSPALARAMEAEHRAFLWHVIGPTGDGKLETLLTAPSSFVDEQLAKVYGLQGITGATLRQTPLDATRRAGLLTQTAFLTAHAAAAGSHPIKRGKEILERLLCAELPVPPPDIPDVAPPGANVSTRERFAVHGKSACAAGCHALMDPLGFAFEHFDGIGAYRETDGGKPVDASGAVALGGGDRPFRNAVELARTLSTSAEVRQCVVKQLLRYAWKRKEVPGDAASLAAAGAAFARAGFDLREALVALVRTRSFLYRQPSPGEVLP